MPIDFESIKEHERSFLANAYMKKQQRENDLKNKMKSLEQAYRPQMSQANLSKAYIAVKEEYANTRLANPQSKKIAESMQSRERIKKYNEKLRAMNSIEDRFREDVGPGNFPAAKESASITGGLQARAETDYGRFGKEWNKKLNRYDDEQKQLEIIKEKGMEYMNYAKSKAGKKDDKTIEEKAAEEGEERRKEALKSNEIGKDYLKFAKSKAAKPRETTGSDFPLAKGQNIPKEYKGEEKAYMKAKLDKMDTDVLMMEAKVRNKIINKDSVEIENAYLKNIKAKLTLLEQL